MKGRNIEFEYGSKNTIMLKKMLTNTPEMIFEDFKYSHRPKYLLFRKILS